MWQNGMYFVISGMQEKIKSCEIYLWGIYYEPLYMYQENNFYN